MRTCSLCVEPDDDEQLRSLLATSSIGSVPVQADSPLLVVYDHKLAAEAKTNPKQRVPPYREQHMRKCIKAWVEVRGRLAEAAGADSGELALAMGDEFVCYDGGKPGLVQEQ